MSSLKLCKKCREEKPLADFSANHHHSSKDGLQNRCRACQSKFGIKYWRKAALRVYGLTEESYASMLAGQNGTCAICHGTHTGNRRHKNLSVDHCHVTGVVRGILCDDCNVGLARFKDNPKLLVIAAKYLQKGMG